MPLRGRNRSAQCRYTFCLRSVRAFASREAAVGRGSALETDPAIGLAAALDGRGDAGYAAIALDAASDAEAAPTVVASLLGAAGNTVNHEG